MTVAQIQSTLWVRLASQDRRRTDSTVIPASSSAAVATRRGRVDDVHLTGPRDGHEVVDQLPVDVNGLRTHAGSGRCQVRRSDAGRELGDVSSKPPP